MGNFNFPHVSWEYHSVTVGMSKAGKFLKFLGDNFLTKRFSELKKGPLLDLQFVNKEEFMGDVIVEGCLDHSDNKEVEFQMLV